MKQFPIMWQGDNLLMVIDGAKYTVNKHTTKNYDGIVDAIRNKDWQAVSELVIPKPEPVLEYNDGYISVKGDDVTYHGRPLPTGVGKMLIRLLKESLPVDYFIKFINNLMNNPSNRSVEQLYDFLENNNMPITEDGNFMAYKVVGEDYMSYHCDQVTGQHVRYMVGDAPSMPRNLISDDPTLTCHKGLHACSYEYIESFFSGDRLMMVEINPADVVCVPMDYNRSKLRVRKMVVVSEILREDGSKWGSDRNKSYDILSDDNDDDDYGISQYDDDYVDQVRSDAFDDGYKSGHDDGYDEGYQSGLKAGSGGYDHDFGGD